MKKLLAIIFAGSASLSVHHVLKGDEISFNRDIRPILSSRCFTCHGQDEKERKAKLRLDLETGADGAYRTIDGVTAIKPGSLEESELWHRINSDDPDEIMPPPKAHKPPFSVEEKALISRWIKSGAPYEKFWAFAPIRKPDIPETKAGGDRLGAIDGLVHSKLENSGMSFVEEADKRTLIRRLSLDITGIPPTIREIRSFLEDDSPKAYRGLVNRLLDSPRYGEHMARYWLDLVRFADTNGMHKDFYRNNIAYRDWVIRAFNENLGYDDFVRYQLAGDLFEDPSGDQLAASGFNRLHLIIDRGTALPEESFFKNVIDRVTAVGTAFMGMSVHCASCHDHKYDPLTQKDFYSLFAFFNNIEAAPETNGGPRNGLQPPTALLPTKEQQTERTKINEELSKTIEEIKLTQGKSRTTKDEKEKKSLIEKEKKLFAFKKELERKRAALESKMIRAMVMKERATVRKTHVMKRGNYEDPGEEVTRNTPAFLPAMRKKEKVASRMDLAEWFVSPSNPLTARAAANRIWQQFFGVGLVKTSEDLGSQGEYPSHPKLLDYLAAKLMESDWDVKGLVKEIVSSRTYRQSSNAGIKEFTGDPENRKLARGSRFRMDAEMIRDQILSTSGLLVETMYGKSVKPPQPAGLWKAVTMIGERFRADGGDSVFRRSLYTYWKRGMPPPQMTILNAPIRDACAARRERTNTPSQALLLLNEPEYLKAAGNLAKITIDAADDDRARIRFAYETVTSKLPDARETQLLSSLLDDLTKNYEKNHALAEELCKSLAVKDPKDKKLLSAWTIIINALYNLDVSKTRE